MRLALLLVVLATPARADFPETVRDHILPGYAAFAAATAELADTTAQGCDPTQVRPAFHAAYDAWMAVQHLRFGPVESGGHSLAIAFWPDPKAAGARAQRALLQTDARVLEPEAFSEQSVAARGLPALERLLYPAEPLPVDPCPLLRATAADLARIAAEVHAGWTGGFAEVLLTAGEPGNPTYLTRPEARQALFTQLAAGLEFVDDQRLGRPLGTPTTPHPERAEARGSGRSLRNILLALQAMRGMVETLTPDAPQTMAAFDQAIAAAAGLDDPVLAGVADPEGRPSVEKLQAAVAAVRAVILRELAPEMDVGIGFNAQDGD